MPPIVDWEGVVTDASKELMAVSLEQIKEAEAFLVRYHLSAGAYSDHLATSPGALAWYVECINALVRFYNTMPSEGLGTPGPLQVQTAALLVEQVGQVVAYSPAVATTLAKYTNEDAH
mgnify:CR=1 FL=1